MPRQALRIPLHITQRGVNRCAIFLDDDDRPHYLGLLGESAGTHGLRIHTYVLMGNHAKKTEQKTGRRKSSRKIVRDRQAWAEEVEANPI